MTIGEQERILQRMEKYGVPQFVIELQRQHIDYLRKRNHEAYIKRKNKNRAK